MQRWQLIRQRVDLFEANISANKISLLHGQSYAEEEYYNGSRYKYKPFAVLPALHSVLLEIQKEHLFVHFFAAVLHDYNVKLPETS